MLGVPSIAVVSGSSTKPKSLIKYLLKTEPSENAKYHNWTIENKYYTADVQFVEVDDEMLQEEHKTLNIEALVIHMNSNITSGLEDIQKYLGLDDYHTPEVKILLANYCNDMTKVTRTEAVQWCLQNQFEFVELFPDTSTSEDSDDEFTEKHGIERVLEALQANMWSNMVMRQNSDKNKETVDQEELENDEFCNMFGQLLAMKSSITSLPSNERKQCAEQVVTAFWKAIGGDESEISDLSN